MLNYCFVRGGGHKKKFPDLSYVLPSTPSGNYAEDPKPRDMSKELGSPKLKKKNTRNTNAAGKAMFFPSPLFNPAG